jgi:hypothetical protein
MERTTYARPHDRCPSCGSTELLELAMTVSETPLSFAACNSCEWKGWERHGEALPLRSLLSLISVR